MEKTANDTPFDWFRSYFSGCNWFVQLKLKSQSFPVYLLLTFYLFALYLENVMFLFTATLLPYPSSLPSLYCPPSFLTAYWKFSTGFFPISDKIFHTGSIKSVCLSIYLSKCRQFKLRHFLQILKKGHLMKMNLSLHSTHPWSTVSFLHIISNYLFSTSICKWQCYTVTVSPLWDACPVSQ